MNIKLTKKPKNPIIIEGFPGFGLVGTITTEFLIDHLDVEPIGKIEIEESPAMIAIHENKVVQPIGIFYNKKHNLLIIHGITSVSGSEWEIAEAISGIATNLRAKEMISLEGVGSAGEIKGEPNTFYYTSNEKAKKVFEKNKSKPLGEGIIMGVTGALLVKSHGMPMSCIFAETQSKMPDSNAAANVIKILDRYLGLKVDYKPLQKQAQEFEGKIKKLLVQSQEAAKESEKKKQLSYVG